MKKEHSVSSEKEIERMKNLGKILGLDGCLFGNSFKSETNSLEPSEKQDNYHNYIPDLSKLHESTEEDEKTKTLLEDLESCGIRVSDDIPANVNTLSIGGVETYARGGIHVVKAKPKEGKSSKNSIEESVYISDSGVWGVLKRLSDKPLKVRHFDTEQKPYDTQQLLKRILAMSKLAEESAGDNFRIYNFRKVIDNQHKMDMIEAMLNRDHPDVLIIDGIADLLCDFNDVTESRHLVAWLMKIASDFDIALFVVIHTNKNGYDNNSKGHLGAMLEQKSDTVTICEKKNMVTVKCDMSRHRPFDEWSFMWDEDGYLIDSHEVLNKMKFEQAANKTETKSQTKKDRKDKALSIIKANGGSMGRKELTEKLEKGLGLSNSTVSPIITEMIDDKVISIDKDKIITIC